MMIITIAGEAGSGKSTLARQLAGKLHLKFYSMGDVRRKYALSQGMNLEQLNALREKDVTSDRLVDEFQKELAQKEDNFIVDSRLGFHFIPNSIKITIMADIDERAKRIFNDRDNRPSERFSSVEETKKFLEKRHNSDRRIYKELYGIDPFQTKQYDLVIDSTHMTSEEKLKFVLDWLKKRNLIK